MSRKHEKCTLAELESTIIDNNSPANLPMFNEVFPNIYLGGHHLATEKGELFRLKITHVLNASMGEKFGQVNTNENFYKDFDPPLAFLGIPAVDNVNFKLSDHFEDAANFIKEAKQLGGNVAVHCHQGISRSATLVIAYLIIHEDMSAVEALSLLRNKRSVWPNRGFLKQIRDLHNSLIHLDEPYN